MHEVKVIEKWLSSAIIENGFDIIIKSESGYDVSAEV